MFAWFAGLLGSFSLGKQERTFSGGSNYTQTHEAGLYTVLCRGICFVGMDEVIACSLHTCRVIRAATLKLAWVGEDLAGRWVVVESKRCMDGWMDLMSGGGWVSAPHIQFENALFFYNKTGFLRSTPQSCIFSFFSI